MSTPQRGSREDGSAPMSRRGGSTRTIRGLDPDQRRAKRREQLLAAALELFANKGYINTSIEQICQGAYVGNKAFYELFSSKEECYVALLREISERIKQQVMQTVQQLSDEDAAEAFRLLLTTFAHSVVDDPRIGVVAFRDVGGISLDVERQRRDNRRWVAAFLEELWRRFELVPDNPRDDGIEDPADFHALATGIAGGLFEIVASWLHGAAAQQSDISVLISDLIGFVSLVHAGLLGHRAEIECR